MKPTVILDEGRVRLYLGDCLEILPTFPSGKVDMIWTDPPYGHGNLDGDLQAARVRDGVKGARVKEAESIANDAGPEFIKVLKGFLDESARILNRDCCCCCCCVGGGGPTPTFAKTAKWIDERLAFFQAVVWDKSARGHGMGWRYRRNYEFVMVAHRKGGKLLWADDGVAVPNVVRTPPVTDRVHPNEKPLSLVKGFISWHTVPGQMVCDPFMGSGTTGVACVELNRRFVGIESEQKHFDTAVRRITEAVRLKNSGFGIAAAPRNPPQESFGFGKSKRPKP